MKTFIGLITLSATASSVVGIVTQDIFNTLALYTPLALISIVVKNSLDDRRIRRKYKQLMEEK
ncbi:hypothetical protein ACUXQE_001944 [Staphylococcus saprophyticus]|uniref:hypothetical protein n=1 Tax=Staphylococcus TaxID=1279 RepID=UPI0006601772|nr:MULTISPECIES: hypothetical protein [Staphylococcus]MDH9184701.1 hypothetical protein [Staphylococcus epidermidis]QHD15674.1 hypothetical protein FNY53_02665 [Staphylococcus equorum]AMG33025.1 hypothetical protein AL494_04295 [Staphylococcus saprophyticus]ASE58960.1 hypothetical protein CEQ14_07165 [Staphylococcus saprophyticus]MBN6756520.1 hypothetical protein [Staphylococcus saprophyticus]